MIMKFSPWLRKLRKDRSV